MMCGDRWLETGSPWEGDEMTDREQFEKVFPVPVSMVWNGFTYAIVDAHEISSCWDYQLRWETWQAARATPALPQAEHDLEDVRCQCCGYMTYHREHMGCIRSAYKQALPQVPEGMAIVPVEPTPKMIVAFRNSNGFQNGYKAMLAAAKEKGE